jgi:dTMP kinase
MKSGFFFVLEGVDFAGKTTQIEKMEAYLKATGETFLRVHDPGVTRLGIDLRQILLHTAVAPDPLTKAFLFLAARSQMTAELIKPALEADQIVISDRFSFSTMVYQRDAADLDDLEVMCRLAERDCRPDCMIYLDLSETALKARWRDQKSDQMSRNVSEVMNCAKRARHVLSSEELASRVEIIPAARDIDSVHRAIVEIFRDQFHEKMGRPLANPDPGL